MSSPIRLLVLGTGGMANTHAMNFSTITDVQLVAAVDVDLAKVRAFAARHDIPNTFTSLEEAIAWGEFDAVTNVTPDRIHYATTLQCSPPQTCDVRKAAGRKLCQG